ncbi:hypothetical protein GH714_003563 [Hevea brasiliensis]|uniref:FLZ-type domain-containing protein n=1 Tax=Hevea brasiliensis TaxID=3981 RepID=A0A6A6KAI4_HEVBR|nr:hypothetical protein GH714_003563 [Hevea brasiliensis]
MSPTSILDSKPFSGLKNPFLPDLPTPKTPDSETRRTWDKLDSKGIGLGIIDALNDDKTDPNLSKPESRMVLFGSQLKIQVPPLPPSFHSPTESPKSPADFGIKTRNSQLGSFSSGFSHSPAKKSACGSANSGMDTPNSPRVFAGCLSATEMELSEDYTCVISYGPNPRTTHIFDDCIVESCCGIVEFSDSRAETARFLGDGSSYSSGNFLSFCYACKKNGQGKDIYMYSWFMLELGGAKGEMLTTDAEEVTTSSSKSVYRNGNIAVRSPWVMEYAVISGFSSLPWLVKPLYGFISDSVPVFGYQRRSYLVLSGLLCAVSSISDVARRKIFAILIALKSFEFDGCMEVSGWGERLGDLESYHEEAWWVQISKDLIMVQAVSMVVERSRGESQSFSGSLQSLCWVSSAFDGIVSSYFSGFLVDAYGVRFVFGVTALLPLITSAVAVLVKEQHILGPARGQNLALNGLGFLESSKLHIVQLWDALK